MKLIFTLAWRNIFRHKSKTWVIGSILFFGALMMTIGNGIIAGMDQGMQTNIVESFTGDLVLMSDKETDDAVLFSTTGRTVQAFTNFSDIDKALAKQPLIAKYLPAGIGYIWVLNDKGQPIDQYMFGIDFAEYQKFFNNSVRSLEGRLIKPGERGVMVPQRIRDMIYEYCGFWTYPQNSALVTKNLTKDAIAEKSNLDIRQNLVFMGLSQKNATLDILAKVIGVVKFKSLNSLLGFYQLVDLESFRECMGYVTEAQSKTPPRQDQLALLAMEGTDLDDMFSKSTVETLPRPVETQNLASLQTGTPAEAAYNIVFVKLNKGVRIDTAKKQINAYLQETNTGLRAVKWNEAIGMMGQISLLMKSALLLLVSMIFFVAIIIIMNTLSMAAMERMSEIGMMRAVGAKKRFVSQLFMAETSLLSISFGGLGIALGAVLVKGLAMLKLTSENEMLQIFYGGEIFKPLFNSETLFFCLLQLLIVTMLAVIYPLAVARKIRALDAVSRD